MPTKQKATTLGISRSLPLPGSHFVKTSEEAMRAKEETRIQSIFYQTTEKLTQTMEMSVTSSPGWPACYDMLRSFLAN